MRWTDLHIRGLGAQLGDLVSLDDPARHPTNRIPTGQRGISLAHGRNGVDLAIDAGRHAIASLAHTTTGALPTLDWHFHAAIWRGSRGIDFWSRAAYVRTQLGLPPGPGITTEINAMSNSLIGSVDLAARLLTGSHDAHNVLLTGGETFGAPALDHLTADHGIAYGDGGSALIIGRHPGYAQILATHTYNDPTLEQLHRGTTRLAPPGTTEVGTETIRQRKADYLTAVGRDSINSRNNTGITHAAHHALTDADLTLADLDWILLPHYGHHLLQTQCLQPLNLHPDRTLARLGDHVGHVGPNDQIIGLTHLLTSDQTHAGQHIALIGIGVGMTWTATILRITDNLPTTHNQALPFRFPPPPRKSAEHTTRTAP